MMAVVTLRIGTVAVLRLGGEAVRIAPHHFHLDFGLEGQDLLRDSLFRATEFSKLFRQSAALGFPVVQTRLSPWMFSSSTHSA